MSTRRSLLTATALAAGGEMYRSEDLASVIKADPGDPASIRWGQGTVLSWDSETGENTILYKGTELSNLLIVSASSWVLTVQPGDTVGLNIIGSGAAATIYIVGPITPPGPEVRDIVRSAIASNTYSASVSTNQTTSSTSYGDLATTGPTVSNVEIGESGKAIVLITALISASAGTADAAGGYMGYQISGATSVSPSDSDALILVNGDFALNTLILTRNTAVSLAEGLTPGTHTFQAKYKSYASGVTVAFQYRNLTVIAF